MHAGSGSSGSGATVISFPNKQVQTGFDRVELLRILDLYGRMVAAGEWRDYAMNFDRDYAIFSAFRRAAERGATWKATTRNMIASGRFTARVRLTKAKACLRRRKTREVAGARGI